MRAILRASFLIASVFAVGPARAADTGDGSLADHRGRSIDRIVIERQNVFDTSDPKQDNRLYHLANRLHIVTREQTVRDQLLFDSGDALDPSVIAETERILRGNKYIYDASVTAEPNDTGGVDVLVETRDVWTLLPEISISRTGGENRTVFGIEDSNLLGKGQLVVLKHIEDVDRTSKAFEFADRQLAGSWVALGLLVADNSDGYSRLLNIVKPFYALDARTSAGLTVFDDDRRSTLYALGDPAAEFRHRRRLYSAFAGTSTGRRDGWVRRWTIGVVHDDNRFSPALDPTLPPLIPLDRKLVYPYVGLEILEDRFQKSTNSDQIERSEDFYLGTRLTATLGWSDRGIGADRDALIFGASANHSFGSLTKQALLLTASVGGRLERGEATNSIARVSARYYWRQSEKRLFFVLADMLDGQRVDIDTPIEIGGDSGLRGYPLRYQSGDSRALLTIEQRYFTDWYPFKFFRVGGAVFADVGRVWGSNPVGGPQLGWLKNVGIGLRLAPTRISTRKILHIDLAFPLDGDPTIDDVQVLLEAKRSF